MGEEEGGERALERTEGLMRKDGKNAVNVESFGISESGALMDLQLKTQTRYRLSRDATLTKNIKRAKSILV